MNTFDYLDWRGDLTFELDGLNEVDNLVMSVLAYLEFDGVVPETLGSDAIPLSQAAERLKKCEFCSPLFHTSPFFRQIPELMVRAARTPRFRDILLHGFVNQVDYEQSKQFSAMVFTISPEEHFIAFRGTDDTLAGWKEDFQMSFMDEVPAQKQALAYMNDVMANLPGDFHLGGHSKGGNLAVYAAVHSGAGAVDRIRGIYNNDGPGFTEEAIRSAGYQSVLGKIRTFVPRSSIVGMLLEHGEDYMVVGSRTIGIMQHNALSWDVAGPRFAYEREITDSSRNFDAALTSWLNHLSTEQSVQFVDALFDIIQASGAQTVTDLSREKLRSIDSMVRAYRNMEPFTKSLLKKTVRAFLAESQKVIGASIGAEIGALLRRRPRSVPRSTL
jgi:hypothetical protein